MIYNALAAVIAPFYGLGRTALAIAGKLFFAYGFLVAIAAFAADRGLESFALYGRWFAYGLAANIALKILDGLARRVTAAARAALV